MKQKEPTRYSRVTSIRISNEDEELIREALEIRRRDPKHRWASLSRTEFVLNAARREARRIIEAKGS